MKKKYNTQKTLYVILGAIIINNYLNARHGGEEGNPNIVRQQQIQQPQSSISYSTGQTLPWLQYMNIQNPSGTLIISNISTTTSPNGSTPEVTGANTTNPSSSTIINPQTKTTNIILPATTPSALTAQDYTQAQMILSVLNQYLTKIGNGSFNPNALTLLASKYLSPLITQTNPTLTFTGIQQAIATWANDNFIDTSSNNYFNTPGKTYGVSTYAAGAYLISVVVNQKISIEPDLNITTVTTLSQNACTIFFQALLTTYNQNYQTNAQGWFNMLVTNGINTQTNS